MDVEGGYTLTNDQIQAWKEKDFEEYTEYYDAFYDSESNVWLEVPAWMIDGDPTNGPFDFNLNPSHGTIGW